MTRRSKSERDALLVRNGEKMGVGVEALNTYCNNPAEDNRRITAGREDSGMNRRGRGRSLITNGEEIKPLIQYGM